MSDKKKLLVVDGNSIINRAYYGIRPLTTKEGIYTNAVYGMITILTKQLEAVRPDICAVAFDRKEPTFRHKAYADYKAGRHASPDELRSQFPYAKECVSAMGMCVVEQPGYEADDILGTLSKQASDAGWESYLLTGDRDALQLIDGDTTVLLATNKETVVFDETHFREEYGVTPAQFIDVKALMGDKSDNIPGVAGIGEVTALKLISAHGNLDCLYAGLEDAPDIAKGVRAKLERDRENAYFSRMLATIVRDAPLDTPFADLCPMCRKEDKAALRDLFVKLEFTALIKRMNLDSLPTDTDNVCACDTRVSVSADAAAQTEADVISASQLCALDKTKPATVTVRDGTLYTVSEDRVFATPLTDSDLVAFFADRPVSTDDAKQLYHALYDHGFPEPEITFDTAVAAYLLNPGESDYDLIRLSVKYLGTVLPEGASPAVCVRTCARLVTPLTDALRRDGMERLFYEIELPLARVLFRMEVRGFCVDVAGLRAYGDTLGEMCEQYMDNIYAMAGHTFNVNSPKQLGEVLFDELMLPSPTRKRSTGAEILEKLRPYHPIIDNILEYRQVAKLKSTYTDGLCKVAGGDGRIHSCFNQTVTATGRLSSTEPNLQNIPIRTPLGRELRKFFIAKNEDYVLVDADYSQIELRLLAAISEDETMTRAFLEGTDIHAVTASEVFDIPLSCVTPEMRKRAKAVNFGIVYGIGEFSLAEDLGVSRKQAKEYIDGYLKTYPRVSAYLKDVVREAKEKGYVSTLFGRRRYIPELSQTNKTLVAFGERVAMNSPIQGTAADVIKAAMVRLEEELTRSGLDARLILQVHDELIVECHKSCEAEVRTLVRRVMEHALTVSVPLTVDVQAGRNWFDGH